jgi:hypothetical protein
MYDREAASRRLSQVSLYFIEYSTIESRLSRRTAAVSLWSLSRTEGDSTKEVLSRVRDRAR